MRRSSSSYPNAAIRKRRVPSDAFFQIGNELFAFCGVCIYYYDIDSVLIQDNQNNYKKHNVCCEVNGCSFVFSSDQWLVYEEHYMNHHVNICSACLETDYQSYLHHGCCFLSPFLLDLHIEEFHHGGGMFDRGNEKYRCLEESCMTRFETDELRLDHMRKIHGYPRWFRFLPRRKTNVSKKNKPKSHKDGSFSSAVSLVTMEAIDAMSVDDKNGKAEKRAARKDRQKEKRASTPCNFFFSKSGCRRGDKCIFLHERKEIHPEIDSMDIDKVLVDKLRNTSISVPEKLTFGRRHRR